MAENFLENQEIAFEKKESIEAATLEQPSPKYKIGYLAALEEFQSEGRYLNISKEELEKDFGAFIDRIPAMRMELNGVPETEYWLTRGDEYIGRLSIRHELDEKLLLHGGHIGYAIRPSQRKKGYGKKALELGLLETKKLGLDTVLVTCDSTNTASRRIIESHTGVLENKVEGEPGKPTKLRFWIDIKSITSQQS